MSPTTQQQSTSIPPVFSPVIAIGSDPLPVITTYGLNGLIHGDPFPYLPLSPDSPHVTICSIYSRGDLRTRSNTFHMIGNPTFTIPASPKNGFSCLRIYPGLIKIINFSAVENNSFDFGKDNADSYENKNVDPTVLAGDIIKYTAGDMPNSAPGRMLGVGVIKGDFPTEDEYRNLCQQQLAYFNFLTEQADAVWAKDRDKTGIIGMWHRIALHELGDHDLQRHPWRVPIIQKQFKPCPGCTAEIGVLATTCEKCNRDLVEWGLNRYKLLGDNPIDTTDTELYGLVQRAISRFEDVESPSSAKVKK